MRKLLQATLVLALICGASSMFAQRYLEEVFTNDEIIVSMDNVFATNIDFMTSNLAGANTLTDIGTLSFLADNDMPIGDEYFDVLDESTDVKVRDIAMDIYYPDPTVDDVEMRPVMIYVHTGNFLPPPLNGSTTGLKTDSAAVNLCMQWAKRGYVAVSCDYRLGWNPLAELVQERRGTLLNAVYRAIHDVKMGVRYLRADAMGDNIYEIDESRIVVYGQGSGGYVSTSYMTLDNAGVELYLEKFLPNPFEPTESYVDTLAVGTIDGWGFSPSVNLYRDNGISADVAMTVNAGGALADESWLEAGDVPMVAFGCVRDDFAPFDEGTVIVPTTQEEVVDVHGPNFFIQKANDLGNNDVFAGIADGDVYTDAARAHHGETYDVSNGNTITVNDTPEGLFSLIRPLASFLTNESAPWEWWDPNSPIATTVIDPETGATAHLASLQSNPDMSPEKGLAYLDSIQGYMLPRIMCALDLPENWCADPGDVPPNNECAGAVDIDDLFHTGDAGVTQYSDMQDNTEATSEDTDPTTGYEDCFGEPAFDVTPVLNNTLFFTFEGDGEDYTIETGDCDGTTTNYIAFGDTQYQIYEGTSCDDLTPVTTGCSEDSQNAVTDDYFAGLDFTTTDGTMYWIMVDGFNGVDVAQVGVLADGEYCVEVTQLTVGVEELSSSSLDIYPNPTNGLVTITAAGQIDQMTIYNVIGEVVEYVTAPQSSQLVIDLSAYESGMYIVTAKTGDQVITERLIKE